MMRFGILKRSEDEGFAGSTARRHKNIKDVRRDLRKRGDGEKDCESRDDDDLRKRGDGEKDCESRDDDPTKTTRLPPPPSGIPVPPPPLPLGPPTTALPDGGIPFLSVSAFPAMTTGPPISAEAATTAGISAAATATTLLLNAPAITPPILPSGTRKTGDGPQTVKAAGHHRLTPKAVDALVAFGVIMGISLAGFLIFTVLRCMKRKRSEASAYGDLEEDIYNSERARTSMGEREPTSMSETTTIAPPPEAYVVDSTPSHKFYLPPVIRMSQRPWSGSLYRQSKTSQVTEDPFADQAYSGPEKDLFPPPVAVIEPLTRREVGGMREDPFRDPEKEETDREEVERDELESVRASTVRGFKTTPSWVDDQAARIFWADR